MNLDFPPDMTVEDIRSAVAGMSVEECEQTLYDWRGIWARSSQVLPAGDWRTWLIMGGRGSGKTRPGAEAVREIVGRDPQAVIALIGPTAADVRKVMIEGESGLLSVFPPHQRPVYKPSIREVRFHNGALGLTYSAEEPERLRGPQHSFAWLDEIAAYPELKELWDLMVPGLRLGRDPRRIATTTPKPLRFLHTLIADPWTRTSRMSTWENRLNLPDSTLDELTRVYAGTRIGRQELEGELLDEAEGALWNRARIENLRVDKAPELVRIVIAIDPATTSGADADECGIVAAGVGVDGHGYVLADRTCRLPPDQWADRAVSLFDLLNADRIVAEVNNGGDLVESVIRTVRASIPYTKVHASKGKIARAEPIAALYEQSKVHHVGAKFAELEDEMVNFVPGMTKSPNRADALVWALTNLMLKPAREGRAIWVS
jgi:phage terminase large subunit-like protein